MDKHVELLKLLNELSYVMECFAQGFTGEAKTAMSDALVVIKQSPLLSDEAKAKFQERYADARSKMQSSDPFDKGGGYASYSLRNLWNALYSRGYKLDELPII